MTIQVTLPNALASCVREAATREHVSVDVFIVTALSRQLGSVPLRPSIAERAARVDWEKVDAILGRVPSAMPVMGDER